MPCSEYIATEVAIKLRVKDNLLSINLITLILSIQYIHMLLTVLEIRIRNWLAVILKIGYCIGY